MVSKKKYDVVTTFRNYDLHGAAAAGNIGLVMYAIQNDQPINAVLGGLLPIHAAASGGSVEVVRFLINEGADVNIPRLPSSTGPPIGVGGAGNIVGPNGIVGDHHHHGAGGEKLHKGRLGSSAGSSQPSTATSVRPDSARAGQPFPIGRRGSTPLHFAAAQGHIGVARLLLENGANVAAVDCDKATPEAVARAAGQWRIIEFLREWQANDNGAPRISSETARGTASSSNGGLRPGGVAPDFKFGNTNVSTASLPLTATHPASHSTSSLGKYPNTGRRPSLPSIYESPPSTSYPRPASKQKSTPSRPATASSAQGSASSLPREPTSTRRPNTAGANRELQMYSSTDDAPSKGSLTSARNHAASSVHSAASKFNRIFKRTNMRPATASGALSTPSDTLSPAPPTGTRSRSPSTSKAADHRDRGGGFFHTHHHHGPPNHRDKLHHPVSRDAISGPIAIGQSPYTSIPDLARPAMAEAKMTSNSSGAADLSTSPDDFAEDESNILKTLNLSPQELQYAKAMGLLPDRIKNARTAPATQTSFGSKPPGPAIKSYHSHSVLSTKPSASASPSPRVVPRHRANLGPGGGLALNVADTGSQEDGIPTRSRLDVVSPVPSGRLSPAVHVPRPAASFSSLNRSTDGLRQLSRNASVSSLDTSLTSKSNTTDSNEAVRSPEAGEESGTDYVSRQVRTHPSGSNLSPYSGSAAGGASPVSPATGYGYPEQSPTSAGLTPYMNGKLVSSRQQAMELIEAQKRAIRDDMEQKMKARRLASASSQRTIDSPLSATTGVPDTPLTPIGLTVTEEGAVDEEDDDGSMAEEDITSLRERLEQLGESVQIERRFARGEQQAKRWNRESGLEEGNYDDHLGDVERVGTVPISSSVLTRSEMLDGYLRKGEASESEKVKRPPTPKRDVFGRPVTPKQGRPTTPKENRPTTPKNSPLPASSRTYDAPRENRILPPPQKTPSRQHLGLEQTRGISKSDFALNSYINKDDLLGRERAWTTTEVRPRVGPAPPARPSTATTGREPSRQNNGNLTIDIIQTAPTPTDAPNTPLKGNPPVGTTVAGDRGESLRHRRRCSSIPLTIDAKMAQEKVKDEVTNKQDRQRSASRTRKPPTPTGSKGEQSVLLHRVTTTTPPSPLPLTSPAPSSEVPFTYNSFSSSGHASTENILPTTPVPHLPSAVDLHNMHVSRAREEAMRAMEVPQVRHSPQFESPDPVGNWRNSPPAPAERRLGLGTSNNAQFGYDSVRSFNEEKGDKQWRLLGVDTRGSDSPSPLQQQKSPQKKLGGFFSRLKR